MYENARHLQRTLKLRSETRIWIVYLVHSCANRRLISDKDKLGHQYQVNSSPNW